MPSAQFSFHRTARAARSILLATVAARLGLLTIAVATTACGDTATQRIVSAESGAIDLKMPKPAFTLTDTDGKPYAFAERTAGKVTFLEFGYTNCPDICPVHMSNLATVLGKLAPSDRMRTAVVFVSIDPDRDSSSVLRKWLDSFDAGFVGLTGTRDELNAVQAAVGFGAATIATEQNGAVEVTHAAPLIVFTADDTAHVMYPFGTRQADWARDMPLLLARKGSGAPRPAPVAVARAYVVIPAGSAPAVIYLTVRNPVSAPDTLLSIATSSVGPASLHETVQASAAGMVNMRPVSAFVVGPNETIRLAPGGAHAMIMPVQARLLRGARVPMTLLFARSGVIRVDATVIGFADVDSATARR